MSKLLLLSVAAVVTFLLLRWFVHLERAGRRLTIFLFIFGLVVLESVIYPNQDLVPSGIFHPGGSTGGGLSFRLPDVLILLALLARLIARGRRQRFDGASIAWLLFVFWVTASAVFGHERGNGTTFINYEGKMVVYLCFFLVAAGVPAHEYAYSPAVRRFLFGAATLAGINIALDRMQVTVNLSLPGLPINDLGPVGADAATIFLGLALISAALGLCSAHGRLPLLLASVPLYASSLVANQRAALIAAGLGLVSFAALLPFARARLRTTPIEIVIGASCAVFLFMVPVLVTSITRPEPVVPLASNLTATFDTQAKQLSAEDRRNQWRTVRTLIARHPLTGSGLGTVYEHYDPGSKTFVMTDISHNIGLDLMMRTGAIGLALFVGALGLSLLSGVTVWRRHPDPLIAAIALACTSTLIGLVGKGMVESIFEKFRLATLLGLLVGMIASSRLSLVNPVRAEVSERPPQPAASRGLAWN